jgi:hypothetical protein
MCYPVTCKTCGKVTWSGCGNHVASVKAVIPAENWCDGHADAHGDSWLKRILGR